MTAETVPINNSWPSYEDSNWIIDRKAVSFERRPLSPEEYIIYVIEADGGDGDAAANELKENRPLWVKDNKVGMSKYELVRSVRDITGHADYDGVGDADMEYYTATLNADAFEKSMQTPGMSKPTNKLPPGTVNYDFDSLSSPNGTITISYSVEWNGNGTATTRGTWRLFGEWTLVQLRST